MLLTKQQRRAIHRVWLRGGTGMTYLEFRRTAQMASYDSCLMVYWEGMWLGIERDGYTHS